MIGVSYFRAQFRYRVTKDYGLVKKITWEHITLNATKHSQFYYHTFKFRSASLLNISLVAQLNLEQNFGRMLPDKLSHVFLIICHRDLTLCGIRKIHSGNILFCAV